MSILQQNVFIENNNEKISIIICFWVVVKIKKGIGMLT